MSEVDQAKEFDAELRWRLDADRGDRKSFRIVQVNPPDSACSVQIGVGLTSASWHPENRVAEQAANELSA